VSRDELDSPDWSFLEIRARDPDLALSIRSRLLQLDSIPSTAHELHSLLAIPELKGVPLLVVRLNFTHSYDLKHSWLTFVSPPLPTPSARQQERPSDSPLRRGSHCTTQACKDYESSSISKSPSKLDLRGGPSARMTDAS
jgi:hypothetical protein